MEGRFYTRARRQPWVLGKLGKDWTLPWVLTSEEIITVLGVVGLLAVTRGLWANFGVFFNTLILAGSVGGSVAALRHFKPEARSVRAFLRGCLAYAWARITRPRTSPVRLTRRRLYAAELDDRR